MDEKTYAKRYLKSMLLAQLGEAHTDGSLLAGQMAGDLLNNPDKVVEFLKSAREGKEIFHKALKLLFVGIRKNNLQMPPELEEYILHTLTHEPKFKSYNAAKPDKVIIDSAILYTIRSYLEMFDTPDFVKMRRKPLKPTRKLVSDSYCLCDAVWEVLQEMKLIKYSGSTSRYVIDIWDNREKVRQKLTS